MGGTCSHEGKYHFGVRLLLRTCSQQFLLSVETWCSEYGEGLQWIMQHSPGFFPSLYTAFCYCGNGRSPPTFSPSDREKQPIRLERNYDKIPFHRFLTSKDLFGFFVLFIIMSVICFFLSLSIGRPRKFYSC